MKRKGPQFLQDLHEMIYWARRYCDRRATYAPSNFNRAYDRLLADYPELKELDKNVDKTLMNEGEFFPYAQDGYHEEFGYEARPTKYDAPKTYCGILPDHPPSIESTTTYNNDKEIKENSESDAPPIKQHVRLRLVKCSMCDQFAEYITIKKDIPPISYCGLHKPWREDGL